MSCIKFSWWELTKEQQDGLKANKAAYDESYPQLQTNQYIELIKAGFDAHRKVLAHERAMRMLGVRRKEWRDRNPEVYSTQEKAEKEGSEYYAKWRASFTLPFNCLGHFDNADVATGYITVKMSETTNEYDCIRFEIETFPV
jgi:hypothetical protein